jgi:DNA-binding Lrp family transcriptional regulator
LQIADEVGMVSNLIWSEIAKKVSMSTQSVYNSFKKLDDCGYFIETRTDIDGNKLFRGYRNIQLLQFQCEEADGKNATLSARGATKDIHKHIVGMAKKFGGYLNLKEYSLVNTKAFRKMSAPAQRITMLLCWEHSGRAAKYGMDGIKTYDIILTMDRIAGILGYDLNSRCKKERRNARRNIKSYFDAIVASRLLPVKIDHRYALCWSKEDFGKSLPYHPIHADIKGSENDSIADTVNRRIINTELKKEGIEVSADVIEESLTPLDEQFRTFTGIKILAQGVKKIVVSCIKQFGTIIPSAINNLTREFLESFKIPDTQRAALSAA